MESNQRFNRNVISKILKRAAELEHDENIADESDGLTLGELQQVSKEVGIDPRYIHQALRELQTPTRPMPLISRLLGGPFKYNILETAPGILTGDKWEEIVSEIRRIHGGIGKTSKLGKTFEWEQRKQEVGYIQISLSPKNDTTKIHLNANYRYHASIIYTFTGIFGGVFLFLFLDKMGLTGVTQIIATILGTTGLVTAARFYLSGWMKKKRKTYNKLIGRFREMLDPDHKTEHSPSTTMPEAEEHPIPEADFQSVQRNKIKNYLLKISNFQRINGCVQGTDAILIAIHPVGNTFTTFLYIRITTGKLPLQLFNHGSNIILDFQF